MSVVLETKLNFPVAYRGKMRDTYDIGDKLLLIATDRISAFDCGLPCGIPDKGLVLNQLSAFWLEKTKHNGITASGWNKELPALPEKIIEETSQRYRTAYNKLVGKDIQK